MEERVKYWRAFVSYIFRQFSQDKCSSIAAELTVTSLLALVPLSAMVFALLAFVPSFQSLAEQAQALLFKYFVPGTGETVKLYINEFVTKARELSGVGSLMLLLTALLMMRTVDVSLNNIWHVKAQKSFVRTFLVYWAVLTLGPILLGSSLLLTSYIESLPVISDVVAEAGQLMSVWLPFIMAAIAFSVIYYVVPNSQIKVAHAVIAGGITAVLFELAKFGFGIFVSSFSTYQLIFGALAAIPLFLIWIYLSWNIVLFGAEICHGLDAFELDSEDVSEHPFIEMLRLLNVLSKVQSEGKALSTAELKKALGSEWGEHYISWLEILVEKQVVAKTEDANYCLLMPAGSLTYGQVYVIVGKQFPTTAEINHSDLSDEIKSKLHSIDQSFDRLLSDHLAIAHRPEKSY